MDRLRSVFFADFSLAVRLPPPDKPAVGVEAGASLLPRQEGTLASSFPYRSYRMPASSFFVFHTLESPAHS